MWYVLIIFMLGIAVTYIVAINLEKAFHKMGSKKKEKKTSTGYVSRKQRMREYNKRN